MFKTTPTLFKTKFNKHQIKQFRKQRVLSAYYKNRREEWREKWNPKPQAQWMYKRWFKEAVSVNQFMAYMKEKAKFQDLARKRVMKELTTATKETA